MQSNAIIKTSLTFILDSSINLNRAKIKKRIKPVEWKDDAKKAKAKQIRSFCLEDFSSSIKAKNIPPKAFEKHCFNCAKVKKIASVDKKKSNAKIV